MSSGSALPISRSCTELEDGTSKPIRRKSFRGAIGTSPKIDDHTLPHRRQLMGCIVRYSKSSHSMFTMGQFLPRHLTDRAAALPHKTAAPTVRHRGSYGPI